MADKDDGLFLLEVLIDKIVFTKSPCFTDKDFQTCVNIQCSTVDSLEICDDEPGTNIPKSEGPFIKTFNSGKSCLFSLKETEIKEAMSKFPIRVSIYKSLPCGCLPTKIVMGEATIDMTKEFVQARNKFLDDPNSVSYQALKDSFRIVGQDGAEAGEIVMFLRISCFGKLIVTKFQGSSAAPNLKSGEAPAVIDRSCLPQKSHQTPQDPCVCGASRHLVAASGIGGSSRPACTVSQAHGPGRDPFNNMPCEESDDPCYCCGAKPTMKQRMACRNTDKYCLHVPKGRSKQFEEMGTNLNGNELKIKVPATSSIIKKISETHCLMQSPYNKSPSGGLCQTPCGKNQISLSMPSEAACCNGAQLANTQFTCTTEGCTQASKHGQQVALARGDNKPQDYSNKNTFVLKVAKTANLGDRKCKLEFEVVTPKGPEKKPPIEKANARIQSDPDCDCCIDCCPSGNKIIFKMPSDSCGTGHKQRSHFNYTTDGVGDIARDDTDQLVAKTAENYQGVNYDLPSQVIKLRIAKIVEMPGRKSKLEYQFITPAITHEKSVPTTDTRTAQCVSTSSGCCNVKCTTLHSPFDQDSVMVNTAEMRSSISPPLLDLYQTQLHLKGEVETTAGCDSSHWLTDSSITNFDDTVNPITGTADLFSNSSTCTISAMRSRHRSVSFSETVDYFLELQNDTNQFSAIHFDLKRRKENQMFGKNETAVYMTLLEEFGKFKNSGTQATGSINKCLQMSSDKISASLFQEIPYNNRQNTNLLYINNKSDIYNKIRNPEVYFCGRKKNECKLKLGMGSQESLPKRFRKEDLSSHSAKKHSGKNMSVISTQAKSVSSSVSMQTKKSKQASSGTATPKTVSIKTDKAPKPCPAIGTIKDDMMITVSHIKISSKKPCPIHGKDPCQGPKCVAAASQGEGQAPVKITTVNNPRRGVFELVIRKMTGAPLATNELMLEWTPPSSRVHPCSNSNVIHPAAICRKPSCRRSKYKLIACRPSLPKQKCILPCKQKYTKKIYKRPCSTMPLVTCPVMPCRRCCKQPYCGKSCSPSRLCLPAPLCALPSTCKSPCPPAPCYQMPHLPVPSCKNPCLSPCLSSPCLQTCRPCPVGKKYVRRARSHPRLKARTKRISPCLNKSKACPIVRGRSTVVPCNNCSSHRSCPRNICLSPCKSLGSCRSCCFTSCGY